MGVMALIRYRAMIPFIYLLLLALQLGSKALLLLHPAIRSIGHNTAAGSAVILGLIAMLLTGFVLSLLGERGPNPGDDYKTAVQSGGNSSRPVTK